MGPLDQLVSQASGIGFESVEQPLPADPCLALPGHGRTEEPTYC